jgi:PGDYG protein
MISETLIESPDLRSDPNARRVYKDEIVLVEFAASDGVLQSAVGTNRYAAGDALITGSTGDRWCVSRDRFDSKYRADPPLEAGQPGRYRNLPVTVLAKRIDAPFRIARSTGGDVLRGAGGDWLVQYAPGDHGVVAQDRFDKVYRCFVTAGT